MYVVSATIGRNLGTTPMSAQRWHEFIADTQGTLEQNTFERQRESIELRMGRGEWAGIEEDSAMVTVLLRSGLSDAAKANLKRDLTELARFYEQDAIALTIGQSELC